MRECPPFIEHVQKLVDLRRFLVMTESRFPAEMQPVFRNMEVNYNPWAIGYSSRALWADGLEVPLASSKGSFDVLLWVGCAGSFDARGQKVSRALAADHATPAIPVEAHGPSEAGPQAHAPQRCPRTSAASGSSSTSRTCITRPAS